MQTYDGKIKADHQRAQQRKLTLHAPDSLPDDCITVARSAAVVAVAFKPTFTAALDDTDRVAVFTMPDPQHRIGVAKVTNPLGWAADTALVATCNSGRVTVTAGQRTSPAQQSVTLDSKGRLRLAPSAVAVLHADSATQVLAIAVPAAGELVLLPAAAALAQLTGPRSYTAQPPSQRSETETPARSRVRSRFRAEEVA